MRTALAITIAVTSILALCNTVYAESQMDGSGAAVINGNNPKMYQSVLRIVLSNQSSIARGTFLVYGDDLFLHAYVLPQDWFFSYGNDGSFHGSGPIQTTEGQQYNMTIDGTRVFATTTGSLWKVSADMQGNNTDLILNYFATGTDPIPTVNLSQNATVIIPNGNSAVVNKAFYYPLNLEAKGHDCNMAERGQYWSRHTKPGRSWQHCIHFQQRTVKHRRHLQLQICKAWGLLLFLHNTPVENWCCDHLLIFSRFFICKTRHLQYSHTVVDTIYENQVDLLYSLYW